MYVAAIAGPSNSGKTTLISALIRRYSTSGLRVGAIKHTHHPLNDERRGDTAAFEAAGASPVILAGNGAAVIFGHHAASRVPYENPADLLEHFDTDIVLIEGFKESGDWPVVTISADVRPTPEELALILDRIWHPS